MSHIATGLSGSPIRQLMLPSWLVATLPMLGNLTLRSKGDDLYIKSNVKTRSIYLKSTNHDSTTIRGIRVSHFTDSFETVQKFDIGTEISHYIKEYFLIHLILKNPANCFMMVVLVQDRNHLYEVLNFSAKKSNKTNLKMTMRFRNKESFSWLQKWKKKFFQNFLRNFYCYQYEK